MKKFTLKINGSAKQITADPDTPLLWALRDNLGMSGTKFGCGMAQCGACTVHVNGIATRSCVTPISTLAGKNITTIEGVAVNGLHPVQKAWIAEDVAQCGFCQGGQIMSAIVLLKKTPNPTDDQIDEAMAGNICRCGTYVRVRQAIKTAAKS